jgi:hypothetical protein
MISRIPVLKIKRLFEAETTYLSLQIRNLRATDSLAPKVGISGPRTARMSAHNLVS